MSDLFLTAGRLLPLLDLTSLRDARDDDVLGLCRAAMTPVGPVAAVCVWPQFVAQVKRMLAGKPVWVAGVANVPEGRAEPELVLTECRALLQDGADEIDLVMPYEVWLAGERAKARNLVAKVKAVTGGRALLKVILETGALRDPQTIAAASRDMVSAGADFLKTCTGKRHGGATLEAAEAMLRVIAESGGTVGFKAAGGIREVSQAAEYLELADSLLGDGWVAPEHFRIGASSLLDELLEDLSHMELHTGEDEP
ncbi:MAG: deoxyribose-phosphate aldolase [Kiloniellales bacterium]